MNNPISSLSVAEELEFERLDERIKDIAKRYFSDRNKAYSKGYSIGYSDGYEQAREDFAG